MFCIVSSFFLPTYASFDVFSFQISLAEDFKFDHDLSFLVEYDNCYTPQVVLEMGDSAAGMPLV